MTGWVIGFLIYVASFSTIAIIIGDGEHPGRTQFMMMVIFACIVKAAQWYDRMLIYKDTPSTGGSRNDVLPNFARCTLE